MNSLLHGLKLPRSRRSAGFSLVEVLAAVGIIGIIAFLAIPNIVAIKEDSERNLAISRAEALNMATVSYIQANGRENVAAGWASADNQGRYTLLIPYLSFAPAAITEYTPSGFTITLSASLTSLTKAALADASGTAISY